MHYLEENKIGFNTGAARVPIVPSAILYDLSIGRADVRPDAAMGARAVASASSNPPAEGNVGAGAEHRPGGDDQVVALFDDDFAAHEAAGNWEGGDVLAPGELWVEGEARENSLDSRRFGVVPESALEGRVLVVLWSRSHAPGAGRRILRQVR